MFMDPNTDQFFDNTNGQSEVVIKTLQDLESVNFDMSFINDAKFNTLKSMEMPLPNLPVGKKNPFSKNNN